MVDMITITIDPNMPLEKDQIWIGFGWCVNGLCELALRANSRASIYDSRKMGFADWRNCWRCNGPAM